jgi:hypothetical protein
MQPNAATRNEIVIAGPALVAAAIPVIENSPAPIMAPTPSATNPGAVSVFFNPFSDSDASARSCAIGFLFQIDIKVSLVNRFSNIVFYETNQTKIFLLVDFKLRTRIPH